MQSPHRATHVAFHVGASKIDRLPVRSALSSLAAAARAYHDGMDRRLFGLVKPALAWGGWLGSAGLVAIALAAAFALERFLHVGNLSLVFLPAVLASAIAWGLLPSLFACFLSVLAFNFFFLPPLYTFTIADPENILALAIFAAVAAITASLPRGPGGR
jgi:K+-sensing histidine kinase KdpD